MSASTMLRAAPTPQTAGRRPRTQGTRRVHPTTTSGTPPAERRRPCHRCRVARHQPEPLRVGQRTQHSVRMMCRLRRQCTTVAPTRRKQARIHRLDIHRCERLQRTRPDTRRDQRNGRREPECFVARRFSGWFSNHSPRYAATVTVDRPTNRPRRPPPRPHATRPPPTSSSRSRPSTVDVASPSPDGAAARSRTTTPHHA